MVHAQLHAIVLLLLSVLISAAAISERFTFAKSHVVPGQGAWWKATPADERLPGRRLAQAISFEQHQPPGANSAVCVVLKDEGPRLWEFAQYHSWLGTAWDEMRWNG
ncbi:hypothetical protein TSOC_009722 [Tetrabaena socialis]|uniref:Uncharacterized protein n=1 Tax=Tetrabaena socialis TaxID=47790 RepID=A0A2J7ZV43_9CHLO|nr:hypothetical protein TSOC_009722 [Tetrabaena socialis]|eukprot:PNH04146.1 hypothetical protein TSOC_009722 [Tetrabaena socialis]